MGAIADGWRFPWCLFKLSDADLNAAGMTKTVIAGDFVSPAATANRGERALANIDRGWLPWSATICQVAIALAAGNLVPLVAL
jgi:hypothetical protein